MFLKELCDVFFDFCNYLNQLVEADICPPSAGVCTEVFAYLKSIFFLSTVSLINNK